MITNHEQERNNEMNKSETVAITLDQSQVLIIEQMTPRERGVILSTIFSLVRNTEKEDGLVGDDGGWDTDAFAIEGIDDDRNDALMSMAKGIANAMSANDCNIHLVTE